MEGGLEGEPTLFLAVGVEVGVAKARAKLLCLAPKCLVFVSLSHADPWFSSDPSVPLGFRGLYNACVLSVVSSRGSPLPLKNKVWPP